MQPLFEKPSELMAWSLQADLGDAQLADTFRQYYSSMFTKGFSGRQRAKFDYQSEDITRRIRNGEIRRVLDLGCGCGSMALWLAVQGAEVVGVDIKEDRMAVARRRQELISAATGRELKVTFDLKSIFDLSDSEPFDAIWMDHTFHHVEPRQQLYRKVAQLLRPNGWVYVVEPNAWNPLVQLIMIRMRGFKTLKTYPGPDGEPVLYGDERITTPGLIKRGFSRVGMRNIKSTFFGAPVPLLDGKLPQIAAPAWAHYLLRAQKPAS